MNQKQSTGLATSFIPFLFITLNALGQHEVSPVTAKNLYTLAANESPISNVPLNEISSAAYRHFKKNFLSLTTRTR